MRDVPLDNFKAIDDSTVLACHNIFQALQLNGSDKEKAADAIDVAKATCNGGEAKVAIKIISHLIDRFVGHSEERASESNLIMEVLRPFIVECITNSCKDIQFEW